jgi:outer membrane immunogenic protein
MNKSLLAGAALAALTASSVFAADMPLKAPVKISAYSWSGFYIGANVGWSFGRADTDWAIAGGAAGSTSQKLDGILGGFQEGYNWQFGNSVFGIEADFQGSAQKGSSALTFVLGANPPDTNIGEVKLPWFGTIRGRVGVTPSDRWLIYATGGAAYGAITSNATSVTTVAGVATTAAASSTTVHSGWTVGGGVETALAGNWTARLEYLYVDLGRIGGFCATVSPGASSPVCFAGPAGSVYSPIATSVHVTVNIVRFGINYRFGGTPVAAKY